MLISIDTHLLCGMAAAMALCVIPISPVHAGNESDLAPTVTSSGLDVKGLARVPGVIFARNLRDVPGKNLVVVRLEIPPKSADQTPASDPHAGHTHPESVYVYVVKGSIRFGIEGQPAQVVHAGESAFEPAGAVHTILESTSTTKSAWGKAAGAVTDYGRFVWGSLDESLYRSQAACVR